MKFAEDFLEVPVSLPLKVTDGASHYETLLEKLDQPLDIPEGLTEFLQKVFQLSPYLRNCAHRDAGFVIQLLEQGFEKTVSELLQETSQLGLQLETEAEVMAALRINKRRMALLCGLADLGGWWHGAQVTVNLSEFASTTLNATLDFILLAQHKTGKLVLTDPEKPQVNSGLIVLGMGKLGAGELNYSSDIDLIIFYEPAPGMELKTDDPITLLSRLARQFVKIMQERTADGYVFRMDLRLRPDPSSTPLVIPVEAGLIYYEGQGQNWERAALIKAKPVAGDIAAGESFLAELAPFIWRKYLDFAAIRDVHSIKRQIHAHKGHGEINVLGHNVKLGRGGIREIEFFVQTQQLIAGGRNLALRTRVTNEALRELSSLGWIEQSVVDELTQAYWFLRDVEHRLQMVSDEQTHTLPDDEAGLFTIAQMCGEASTKTFATKVRSTLETVSSHYNELFGHSDSLSSATGSLVFTGNEPDAETQRTLATMGYKNPDLIIKTVWSWHTAKYPALRATSAREMLTEMIPGLLETFAATENPDETIILFDRFIAGLPAGIQLFSILQNNEYVSSLVLNILTSAPRLANQISRRPHVFDAMLDPGFANHQSDFESLHQRLKLILDRAPDYEAALDAGRRFYNECSFLYGCQFFSGVLSIDQVKKAYSTLGDVMVAAMYDCVCLEFEKRHGKVPGARTAILGMGRLGSCELTATSDLDLIFLFDFDEERDTSDGEKELPATLYFSRLMQRFIAAMSSPTSEGVIYDLDFRLRPSGNAGPLATHVDGFLKYQKTEAWVWEAQALTRARAIAGDADLCREVSGEIPDILKAFSGRDDLKKEIATMRKRIEKEKGGGDAWDVKIASGGLLDIEFLAQFLVITGHAPNSVSTKEVLKSHSANDLTEQQTKELLDALVLYEEILHLQRICLGDDQNLESAPAGLASRLCEIFDLPNISACNAHLTALQKQIRSIFDEVLPA